MNKTLNKILKFVFAYLMFDALLLGYAGFLPGVQLCGAQAILPTTTLSAAVATQSVTTISLTSVTGVTAANTVLFIADGYGEAVFVNGVNTTAKTVNVTRGYQSPGSATPHLSGAVVFVAAGTTMPNAVKALAPRGSCTRTAQIVLPVISLGSSFSQYSAISDCVGGVWTTGNITPQNGTQFRLLAPNPGTVAYLNIPSSAATGTTLVAGTFYCEEIDVAYSKYATGLGILLGTTGGTDKHLVALFDATGKLIANSAVAGQTAGTASTYETIPFTVPYYIVGPAQYFGCVQSNGTTATVRMEVTGTQDTYLTQSFTGVFGTIPATMTTVPTTFTTAVGPYEFVY